MVRHGFIDYKIPIFWTCPNTHLHKIEGLDPLLGDLGEVEPRHVGAVGAEDVV